MFQVIKDKIEKIKVKAKKRAVIEIHKRALQKMGYKVFSPNAIELDDDFTPCFMCHVKRWVHRRVARIHIPRAREAKPTGS